jgi:hypothetical protein
MKFARRKFLHLAAGADTGLAARAVYPTQLTTYRVAQLGSFGPDSDSCSAANGSLFDHLIGLASSVGGTVRPRVFAVFEVDHKLELSRPDDRRVGALGALED